MDSLTWDELHKAVLALPKLDGPIYGVPRSGLVVGGIYALVHGLEMTSDIKEANVVIDDAVSVEGKMYKRLQDEGFKGSYLAIVWYTRTVPISMLNVGVIVNPIRPVLFPWQRRPSENKEA